MSAILLRYTDALHELWCRLSGIEQWPAPGSDDLARQRFDREYDAILAEMALSLPAHRR